MTGKSKLIEVLNNKEYFNFKGYFYVTFGSHDDDCGYLVINNKITLNIIEKDGDISILGGDEISGGHWYDLDDDDTEYMNECLNKVYQALEKECA